MIASLLTKLFSFILSIIASLVHIILLPLTSLVNALIPDLHTWSTSISEFINTYIPGITYFLSWLGPFTLSVIKLEMSLISIFFTCYAAYLTIHTTVYLITKIKSMFN